MNILSNCRHAVIVAVIAAITFSVKCTTAQVVNYINPISIVNRSIDVNKPVGATTGQANVTPGGAATYQIPIFCSPGTNGMQPSLSVAYNSQAGNGSLGWGFDLFGLSSVSRVPKTMIQDDSMTSVTMTKNDMFALDGNRLYIRTGVYGASGATYNSEMADFNTLTSMGASGSGPQWFKVVTPDGTVKEYGNTADSRTVKTADNSGTVGLWRLNKVTDFNGNYMTCEYDLQSGLITRIAYTGNALAGQQPYNEIVFTYGQRSDYNTTYPYYNAPIFDKLLLVGITVKAEGSIVKKYHFNYNYGANDIYSLLNEIIELDGSGNALNSTVISWGDKLSTGANSMTVQEGMVSTINYDPCHSPISILNLWMKHFPNWWSQEQKDKALGGFVQKMPAPTNKGYLFGDFDGDGLTDFVRLETKEIYVGPTRKIISWEYYSNTSAVAYPPLYNADAGGNISHTAKSMILLEGAVSDINGDGKDELFLSINDFEKGADSIDIVCYQLANAALVELPQYTIKNLYARGFDPGYKASVAFADLDGDQTANNIIVHLGLNDHTYFYNSLPIVNNLTLPAPALDIYGKFKMIDYNGNGKPDIMYTYVMNGTNKSNIYEKKGNSFPLVAVINIMQAIEDSVYQGDFNGDGKTDLLLYKKNLDRWDIAHSTGRTIFVDATAALPSLNSFTQMNIDYSLLTGDYNGDGKTDVLIYTTDQANPGQPGNVKIYYSFGGNFKPIDYGAPSIQNNMGTLMPDVENAGDLNNDGKDEIYFTSVAFFGDACSGRYTYTCSFDDGITPLKVTSVTDGYNNTTAFSYSKLSNPTVYTQGTNTDVRLTTLKGSGTIVASMSQPDGIGGTSTTNFKYEGGLLHKFGKGFLGFNKVTAENTTTGIKSETSYTLDAATLMMNPALSKKYINNNLVSQVQNTFQYVAIYGSNGHGYFRGLFPYTFKTIETDALTGIVNTISYNYGTVGNITANKGNPLTVTETYGAEGSKVTTNSYIAANYATANGTISMLKPASVQTSVAVTGQTAFIKKTNFTYSTNGRLWKTTEWANQTKTLLTTYDYTGNNFGLATKVTNTTSGITDRYKSFTYDARGRFVLKETNMLGHTITYLYNNAFGVKTSVTDIAGNIATYVYDGFGRIKQENLPTGASNIYNYVWDNSVNNGLYYTEEKTANAPDTKTWYDQIGRPVYNTTEGFNGALVYTEKEYNAKGQLYRESKPHYGNELPKWITATYQPNTGRPATTSNDGLITSYAYSGKTVTVTDPAGKISSKTINNFGQVVSSTDNGGTITTVFHSNGKPKTTTTNGTIISFAYDVYGNQTSLTDPNAGTSLFTYNIYGELLTQKDARGNLYSFLYDNAGRMTKKTGPEGVYEYSYVVSGNGKGKPSVLLSPGASVTYAYNIYGLPTTVTENIAGAGYTYNYTYDNFLNNTAITYPNGLLVNNIYNVYGQLTEVKANGNQVWKKASENAAGQILQELQGNGILTTYSYDAQNRLTQIQSPIQRDVYTYENTTGNLLSRSDQMNLLTETFSYDNLDRLTEVMMNGISTKVMKYAPNGNINRKTDAGTYVYDATKLNAVLRIVGTSGTTAIPTLTQDISYTAFNKVQQITENNKKIIYTYGSGQQRNKMSVYNGTTLVKSRIYCGLYEKETTSAGAVTDYCYIATTNGITAVAINGLINYLRKDRQGSITGLINWNKVCLEQYSYDAWGHRRNPQTWEYVGFSTPTLLSRGYTFHEHLDDFGLINMNGRCYDPVVGRFLSPDQVVQAPNLTQSYNRYSYCLNNPLKFSDPSGYTYYRCDATAGWSNGIDYKGWMKYINEHKNDYDAMSYYGMITAINNIIGPAGNGMSGNANSAEMVYPSSAHHRETREATTNGTYIQALNGMAMGKLLSAIITACPIVEKFISLPVSDGYDDDENQYKEQNVKYSTFQVAILPCDGVYLYQGSYNIAGNIAINQNPDGSWGATISAIGLTPASVDFAQINFQGAVSMIVNGKTLYTQKFSQGDNGSIYGTGTYSMGTTSYILPKSGIVDFKITGGYVVSGEGWTAVPIPGQTNYYYRVYPYNN